MASQFPEQGPPPKSGGSKVWLIVLVVLGLLLLACAGICGGCLYVGGKAVKLGAEALTMTQEVMNASPAAKRMVESNEAVKAKYGEDVTVQETAPSVDRLDEFKKRTALWFEMQVTGSMQRGKARVKAVDQEGHWKILEIKVTADDGSVIDVPVTEEDAPELQFNVPAEEKK